MAKLIKEKYPQRAEFFKGKQKEFLELVKNKLNLSINEMANLVSVHERSLRDWRREKFSMPLPAVIKLCKKANVPRPKNIKIKDPFWYSSKGWLKGWLAVKKKYGSRVPIDEEYRKKKWYEWWENEGKFKKHPFIGTCLSFKKPPNSCGLAEFIGIVLGDGGITNKQVTITLHKKDDKKYSKYIVNLVQDLFDVIPSTYERESVVNIVVSRSELVKFFTNMGLCIGSKVRNQVDVPIWIKGSTQFSKYCLRGLFDTDGCFYIDKHKNKNKIYLNCGMNFTNRSLPLLDFFKSKLEEFGYHPTQKTRFGIFLRREEEIKRYFKEIGSGNYKHFNKLDKFLAHKYGEVPKWS